MIFESDEEYTGQDMNLLEHHAKALLASYSLPVPDSWLASEGASIPDSLSYPRVVKSQVPVGGRGKAGGIIVAESPESMRTAVEKLFSLPIKGHLPHALLLEEKIESNRELYLSLRLNRDTRRVEWLASAHGGIEIEDHADSVTSLPLADRDQLSSVLGVPAESLMPLLNNLERCFFHSDLTLLEINPLLVRTDGSLVCADAKCLVDDNARFRQPDLPWPAASGNAPQALGGPIGCIANGAGMAMSTMDSIVAAGGKPANFLDIGGGTGEKEFVKALKQIIALPGVTGIIINIFAGISRCDEIARGIIAAREQLSNLPPLFIRLEGTNRDIAAELLSNADITIEPNLKTCIQKALEPRV